MAKQLPSREERRRERLLGITSRQAVRIMGTLQGVHPRPVRVIVKRDPDRPPGRSDGDVVEFRPLLARDGFLRLTMAEVYKRCSVDPEAQKQIATH